MNIFDYENEDSIGYVSSVDTATLVISVENEKMLSHLQVNHLPE
ncbi:hypothetical protein [Alkalibacterium thalassium]|uniref:Uncharacterized protein n=1 Tax=Alkalibacterium thalassium TaxID=426701 RepID=A0A1G9G2F6_9LACT|nr:hypothetical protein [Alkalibacterium thalassium]SDK94821.1 hypothetical protein SAMN04488098_10944 [Alkalibacterium thalassium]